MQFVTIAEPEHFGDTIAVVMNNHLTRRNILQYSEMQTYAVKHPTREVTKYMSRQRKICHLKLVNVCSSHLVQFFTKFALLSAGFLLSFFDTEHCRSRAVTSTVQVWAWIEVELS